MYSERLKRISSRNCPSSRNCQSKAPGELRGFLRCGRTNLSLWPHQPFSKPRSPFVNNQLTIAEDSLSEEMAEIQQLNDSVYLAYKGNEDGPGPQLLFFHGIQADYEQSPVAFLRNCWSSEDGSEFWVRSWIEQSFPTARVYLIYYDFRIGEDDSCGILDMYAISECILANLLLSLEKIGQTTKNPLILVGQDIGGQVLKAVCLQASKRSRSGYHSPEKLFLEQVKGTFYFSTPHGGLERGMPYLRAQEQMEVVMKTFRVHSPQIARSNEDFRKLRRLYNWRTKVLGANRVGPLIHVPEASARLDADDFLMVDATAMSICKPKSRSASSFCHLERFVQDSLCDFQPKCPLTLDPRHGGVCASFTKTEKEVHGRWTDIVAQSSSHVVQRV